MFRKIFFIECDSQYCTVDYNFFANNLLQGNETVCEFLIYVNDNNTNMVFLLTVEPWSLKKWEIVFANCL